MEIFWQAIEEDVPDDVKLQQLSKAMYQDEKEKAKNKFCELLSSLSPELVRSLMNPIENINHTYIYR